MITITGIAAGNDSTISVQLADAFHVGRFLSEGFERTIAYATGLANVRDVIPFPRTPGSARY